MPKITLKSNEELDIHNILRDLDRCEPERWGWTWRRPTPNLEMGPFTYHNVSGPLRQSIGLPPTKYLDGIDPQPLPVITTEITSGRSEDDIRRMRAAAWHSADHIMVIRHMGQFHIDSLIEGAPQGIGGVPITHEQARAQRKALDPIGEEADRLINYHSYISGVAGPDVVIMSTKGGANDAYQSPQYNVLYRDISYVRSFMDTCEPEPVMVWAGMLQIDGAHNANATVQETWKVMPGLIVQRAINPLSSGWMGMKPEDISLSTVPPTATPVPCVYADPPYAMALQDICGRYKIQAQQNTRCVYSSTREATVTHVLNMLVSELTSADVQSTITPGKGRNAPWHIYNIKAIDNVKQILIGLDGLMETVELRKDGPLRKMARELKKHACLFMEEIVEVGGYLNAVQGGFFVGSAKYPGRNDGGIIRKIEGGMGYGYIFEWIEDYMAPATVHYGYSNVEQYGDDLASPPALISGCAFEDRGRIVYIGELDEEDNVNIRLDRVKRYLDGEAIKPEVEWCADGTILPTTCIPAERRVAEAATLEIGKRLGPDHPEAISEEVLQEAEDIRIEVKGKLIFDVDPAKLKVLPEPHHLGDAVLYEEFEERPMVVVCGTIGESEHPVGPREIINIKHGGIERWEIKVHYLGTPVPVERLVDATAELSANVILAFTIISHDNIHYKNMKRINEPAVEKGIRDRVIIAVGGTQVIPDEAVKTDIDQGFGRDSHGANVTTFLVEEAVRRRGELQARSNPQTTGLLHVYPCPGGGLKGSRGGIGFRFV